MCRHAEAGDLHGLFVVACALAARAFAKARAPIASGVGRISTMRRGARSR
jgi:hypothetical protein